MRKLFVTLIMFTVFFTSFAQTINNNEEKVEARVEVKVYQLKNIHLPSAYQSVIQAMVQADYDKSKSNFVYDYKSNTLVVTATPITHKKVERFLNKIDVPADFLSFKVYLLKTTNTSGFQKGIDSNIVKELKDIDVKGAKIITKAKIMTVPGKEASLTKSPTDGNGYEILFTPTGTENHLIVDLTLNRLIKETSLKDNSIVFNRFKILSSSFPISKEKPVIVGMTYEDNSSAILAIKLLK
jgi:type II secretory pathway component GspD/PulD (secretin)